MGREHADSVKRRYWDGTVGEALANAGANLEVKRPLAVITVQRL